MSQGLPTFEVYFDTDGFPLDLTSPVRTTEVTYYDSGIWIGRDGDRIFVPYHQIEVIREVEEPEPATDNKTESAAEAEREAAVEGERETATEGDAEPSDEPPTDPVE